MDTITIFTSHLEDNQWLFGDFDSLKPVEINDDIANALLETFQFNKESIRTIWNGLNNEDKENVIKASFEDKETADSLVEENDQLDDDLFALVWDKQKVFMIQNTTTRGEWSIYPTRSKSEGVYAFNCLKTGRPLVEWTKALISIAKAISQDVSIVNLVLHDDDISDRGQKTNYVYGDDELCKVFGGGDAFEKYKRSQSITEINVVIFKHLPQTTVKKRLLDNKQLENVHEEVRKIVNESGKNREQAKSEGLDANMVNSEFDLRLQRAFELEKDYIGESYKLSEPNRSSMKECQVLYFSLLRNHVEDFYEWAEKEAHMKVVKWIDIFVSAPLSSDLPDLINEVERKDCLSVIIDYLSMVKGLDNDKYEYVSRLVRRTIIQYPEVNFLFDQSNVPDDCLSGIEFVIGEERKGDIASNVAQGFHVFREKDGLLLSTLGYDNIFDGSNLRWAIKKKYYGDLELKNENGNFAKLQTSRKDSLALVVDDEPRQSRFNGYALYASGYRVILVRTARMLLSMSNCIEEGQLMPEIILRDFDLQFPDVRKKTDYEIMGKVRSFNNVPLWDLNWNVRKEDVTVDLSTYYGEKKESGSEIESNMIDAIRNYRYFCKEDYSTCKWKVGDNNPFWCEKISAPIFVITNGHDFLRIKHAKYLKWQVKDDWLEVQGIEKPVSGLYHPFFTKLRDNNGKFVVKKQFENTRYKTHDDGVKYGINKKRKSHNHGVPVDIYDTVCEMQRRAEEYYDRSHFVKSAVLAQEIIELLNGFHYQMMIKAYQLKSKAENAISMDVVGADEKQLVLDAEERINIIKEDVLRMIYPLNDEEKQGFFRDLIIQYHHHKKERELLEHIFSECRDTCRNNEYFDVEAVFVREMAHLDQRAFGIKDCIRYCKHRKFIKRISDNYK